MLIYLGRAFKAKGTEGSKASEWGYDSHIQTTQDHSASRRDIQGVREDGTGHSIQCLNKLQEELIFLAHEKEATELHTEKKYKIHNL